jgi:hypothetical protein
METNEGIEPNSRLFEMMRSTTAKDRRRISDIKLITFKSLIRFHFGLIRKTRKTWHQSKLSAVQQTTSLSIFQNVSRNGAFTILNFINILVQNHKILHIIISIKIKFKQIFNCNVC